MSPDDARTLARQLANVRPRGAVFVDVRPLELAVMLFIASGESTTEGISAALDVPTATTVDTIDALVARGWAAKSKDRVDHRRTWTALTAKGKRAMTSAKDPPEFAKQSEM